MGVQDLRAGGPQGLETQDGLQELQPKGFETQDGLTRAAGW